MKKILTLFALCAGLFAHGQLKLTLQGAMDSALQKSYDIQLARNNLSISETNNYIGVAGGLPTVTGTASDNEQITSVNQKYSDPTRNTKRPNVGSNSLSAGVTGSFVLYNGSKVSATKKRLETLQRQNQQLLSAQIQNTLAAVMTKYFDVVRQQLYLHTIEQSIEVSRKKLDILQVRKNVGMANNADLYQAQVDLNGLIQTKQAQELVITQAKTDLLTLIFVKPDTKVLIQDTILVDPAMKLDAVRTGLNQNPLLASANSQVEINQQIEKETAALRTPTLRATTGYSFTNNKTAAGFSLLNQSYGPFVGLNFSVPIYSGGVVKRQEKVAAINTRNAIIQRDYVALNNETGMVRTFEAYESSLAQLQTERENYDLSIKLMDLVLQQFNLGQATIIDVKQAQQSFENEGYRIANLAYSAKIAEVELKRLASMLAK
jgi:outer membrane protein TolC